MKNKNKLIIESNDEYKKINSLLVKKIMILMKHIILEIKKIDNSIKKKKRNPK